MHTHERNTFTYRLIHTPRTRTAQRRYRYGQSAKQRRGSASAALISIIKTIQTSTTTEAGSSSSSSQPESESVMCLPFALVSFSSSSSSSSYSDSTSIYENWLSNQISCLIQHKLIAKRYTLLDYTLYTYTSNQKHFVNRAFSSDYIYIYIYAGNHPTILPPYIPPHYISRLHIGACILRVNSSVCRRFFF